MRAIVAAAIVATTALTAPAYAQVYKCKINGSTVFSDKPCEEDAKPITVRPAAGHYTPAAEAPTAAQTQPADPGSATPPARSRLEAVDRRLKQRVIRDEIQRHEASLSAMRARRDRELAALRNQKGRALNNLAGATYLESLSSEMQAITSRYDTDMRLIESKIEKLRQEHDALD